MDKTSYGCAFESTLLALVISLSLSLSLSLSRVLQSHGFDAVFLATTGAAPFLLYKTRLQFLH